MAGNNAIGTGAVVLTANADKLASGLDAAIKDVGKFADKASKAANGKGGGGGGLLGTMLGVAGGVGLAAVGGKAADFISNLFSDLQGRAEKVSLEPNVKAGVEKADTAVRQLSTTFDTVLLGAVSVIAPAMEKITPAIEAILFIAGGVFEEVVDLVGDVIGEVARWIEEMTGVTTATSTGGDIIFGVMRAVAKVIAYTWDVLKVGAGAIAFVAGAIVEGFGTVVKVIGEAVMQLHELAQALPEALRPDWIKGAAAAVSGWGDSIDQAGGKLKKWGAGTFQNFGQSAAQADAWMDRLQDKFSKRVIVKAGFAAPEVDKSPIKLAGAMDRSSASSYSIVTKYNVANSQMNPNSPERVTQELIRQTRDAMLKLVEGFRGAGILKVV